MNFSSSSDTQQHKSTRGHYANAAQANNNIFGHAAEEHDSMFPPNRVRPNAAEDMASKRVAQENYERRMDEALANRRNHGESNIFSQNVPDASKYSYKAAQPQHQNARSQISNVFGDQNDNPYQQQQPDRQYSDVFNQQQQQQQLQQQQQQYQQPHNGMDVQRV